MDYWIYILILLSGGLVTSSSSSLQSLTWPPWASFKDNIPLRKKPTIQILWVIESLHQIQLVWPLQDLRFNEQVNYKLIQVYSVAKHILCSNGTNWRIVPELHLHCLQGSHCRRSQSSLPWISDRTTASINFLFLSRDPRTSNSRTHLIPTIYHARVAQILPIPSLVCSLLYMLYPLEEIFDTGVLYHQKKLP